MTTATHMGMLPEDNRNTPLEEPMSDIRRLKDGPVDMTVSGCEVTQGNYGEQVNFWGIEPGTGDQIALYISRNTAEQQLQRLSLSVDGCVGEGLHFEHIQKGGKTYTNINRIPTIANSTPGFAGAPAAAPQAQAQERQYVPSTPVVSEDKMEAVGLLYADCLSTAYAALSDLSEGSGLEVTGSDVVAATATLFIQMHRR